MFVPSAPAQPASMRVPATSPPETTVFVRACVCVFAHVCMRVRARMCVRACMYARTHACVCAFMHVCVCACVRSCMRVRVYVCACGGGMTGKHRHNPQLFLQEQIAP